MEDEATLSFLRKQAADGAYILSVCTGALVCGAAGLLQGVRATTHWSALHLLPYFGAISVDERVVVDGRMISAGGVTAGIDGALRAAAILRGERTAQVIQLMMQYAPQPPWDCGQPGRAPADVLDIALRVTRELTARREETARRVTGSGKTPALPAALPSSQTSG